MTLLVCRQVYEDVYRVRVARLQDDDPMWKDVRTRYTCTREAGHAGDHIGYDPEAGGHAVWSENFTP